MRFGDFGNGEEQEDRKRSVTLGRNWALQWEILDSKLDSTNLVDIFHLLNLAKAKTFF